MMIHVYCIFMLMTWGYVVPRQAPWLRYVVVGILGYEALMVCLKGVALMLHLIDQTASLTLRLMKRGKVKDMYRLVQGTKPYRLTHHLSGYVVNSILMTTVLTLCRQAHCHVGLLLMLYSITFFFYAHVLMCMYQIVYDLVYSVCNVYRKMYQFVDALV